MRVVGSAHPSKTTVIAVLIQVNGLPITVRVLAQRIVHA